VGRRVAGIEIDWALNERIIVHRRTLGKVPPKRGNPFAQLLRSDLCYAQLLALGEILVGFIGQSGLS
jgi:hypothetical protein